MLMGREVELEGLTADEIHSLFKKIWIASVRDSILTMAPERLTNADFQNVFAKLTHVDVTSNAAIIGAFSETPDEVIHGIYTAFRKVESDSIHAAIETNRQQIYFSGFLHLNEIVSVLQETWMADVPILERSLQAVAMIMALPFTAVVVLWDELTTLFLGVCILLKAASVELINAPLDIHAYFTQTSEATAPVPEEEAPEMDDVPITGYGRLFQRVQREQIEPTKTPVYESAFTLD
ncbi:MAG TPA: hypothetical protein DDY37_04670 [Legionella sp.]|nr:hypothetical protein [Legionella sp.]